MYNPLSLLQHHLAHPSIGLRKAEREREMNFLKPLPLKISNEPQSSSYRLIELLIASFVCVCVLINNI